MEGRELAHVVAAILIMFVVSSLAFVLQEGSFVGIGTVLVFSVIVVALLVIVIVIVDVHESLLRRGSLVHRSTVPRLARR